MGSKRRRHEVVRERQVDLDGTTASSFKRHQLKGKKRSGYIAIRKRPWLFTGGLLGLLVVIIGIFIFLANQPEANDKGQVYSPVDAVTLKAVTQVDPILLASTGTGGVANPVTKTRQGTSALVDSSDKKPEIFYYGAEFCPNCAAERWSMVVALSRFGSFHDLKETTSSSTDSYPATSTFSFYGGSYTSPYLHFVPVEVVNRQGAVLQTPTDEQENLINTFDAPPYIVTQDAGSYPFIDIGNRYLMFGASFNPALLRTDPDNPQSDPLSHKEIATELGSTSQLTSAVLGTANYLTAAICAATNNQPARVCHDSSIQQIEASFSQAGQTGGLGMMVPAFIRHRGKRNLFGG